MSHDPLRGSDRSMAEHSDTRSLCPDCGEWRDSPTSDCANCGFDPTDTRTPDQMDDDLEAMASGNFM